MRLIKKSNYPARDQEFDEARGDVSQFGGLAPPGAAIDLPAGQINRFRGVLQRSGYILPPVFERYKTGQPAPVITRKSPDVIALERQKYGDLTNINFSAGVADAVFLLRPVTTRIHLLIQNTHATQVLSVAFDRNSAGGVGFVLTAGASVFYDIYVPQGDVHISANLAATTGVIAFSNQDLNAPYAGGV
jgi:hypothetical protein